MPFINADVAHLWFSLPNLFYLLPIPLFTAGLFILIWRDIHHARHEARPFVCSILVFAMGYLGLAISIFPWIVPFRFNIWQAAASGQSLSLMLVGVVPLLPLILGYTAYSYYIFRGKSSHEALY
jgi:cytochrome d ubiquinol oxidase subunit II